MSFKKLSASLVFFSALCGSTAVWAQDPTPNVAAILKSWELNYNATPTYTNLNGDDTLTTLEGVTFTFKTGNAANKNTAKATFDKIELKNITTQDGGLIAIGEIDYTNANLEWTKGEAKSTLATPTITMTDAYVKPAAATATPAESVRARMNIAKKTETGALTLTTPEGVAGTSDGFVSTWDGDPATGAGTYDAALKNIVVPEAALAKMDTEGQLKAMGYTSLTLDLTGTVTTTMDTDTMGLASKGSLKENSMGTLTTDVDIKGVPYSSMIQQAEGASVPADQSNSITINKAIVRFDDASITGKILAEVAKRQSTQPENLAMQAGAWVQLGLSQFGMPDLATKTSAAVTAYLKEPKSITVSVQPATPVTIGQIKAMAAPADMIKALGVSVTSND